MATLSNKSHHPSPYAKCEDRSAAPLRTKAFSHIDNIARNPSTSYDKDISQHPEFSNKIEEIKKKYDRLLNRSVNRQNEENGSTLIEHNKSASGAEKNKWDYLNKPFIASHQPYNRIEQPEYSTKSLRKEFIQREDGSARKGEMKSQLEVSRQTLSAMKSELQAKLNDLNVKTTQNSAIKSGVKQDPSQATSNTTSAHPLRYNQSIPTKSILVPSSSEKNKRCDNYYQQISNKYKSISKFVEEPSASKNYLEKHRVDSRQTTVEQSINDNPPSSYLSKYLNQRKYRFEKDKRQQLSVISEKSNSNHSEGIKDIGADFGFIQNKNENNVATSDVHEMTSSTIDQLLDKYTEPNSKNQQEKEQLRSEKNDNGWYKNTVSYLEEKNSAKSGFTPKQDEKQEVKQQLNLKKLENNFGPIKRTTTEEHFININKANLLHNRNEEQQLLINKYIKPSATNQSIKEHNKYQQAKVNTVEIKEATFGKKIEKNTYAIYSAVPKSNQNSEGGETERKELQKFKEKYLKKEMSVNAKQQFNNRQPQKKPAWKTYEFKDNQDISNKIDKIDERIKEIQNNKKNLQIDFIPFEGSKSIQKQTHYINKIMNKQFQEKQEKNNQHQRMQDQKNSTKKDEETVVRPRISSYFDNVKPMYSEITFPEITKAHTNTFAIKLMPVQIYNEEDNPDSKTYQNQVQKDKSNYSNNRKNVKKTEIGVEERKRNVQEKLETTNNIKYLVINFGKQAIIDQVYRNNKIWFDSEPKEAKWEELRRELKQNEIIMTDSQMKNEFELLQSENNPFFSVSDSKCNMKSLVSNFIQTKRHWQQKIFKKFSRQALEKQGFSSNKIDFDKKGFIQIEDIVRFLNIESGTFLRNRDVSIIFKRITKSNVKISFQDLMNTVCQ